MSFGPRLAVLLLIGLALSGCESASDRAMRNSPDYKSGYSDGCASAGARGADMRDSGRVRDEQAYRTDRVYSAGWDTGFNTCRGYQSSASGPPLPGQGPIPDPNPHPF
jgi:hypothetical protein